MDSADAIAHFYKTLLDATTSVVTDDNGDKIAIVAFGNVNRQGQADQTLLFRESTTPIPPYDGHHVAMYVGSNAADYEQAFANVGELVWINPRFTDKTDSLEGARKWKQFRFKDIMDLKTGKLILELEHEMRSIEHEAWPGRSNE